MLERAVEMEVEPKHENKVVLTECAVGAIGNPKDKPVPACVPENEEVEPTQQIKVGYLCDTDDVFEK